MERDSILSGNKLIANFMNFEYIPNTPENKDKGKRPGWWKKGIKIQTRKLHDLVYLGGNHNNLRYHSSWDWLMPVIHKIHVLTLKAQIDSKNFHTYVKLTNAIENTFDSRVDITITYQKVLEFITWYNKNS